MRRVRARARDKGAWRAKGLKRDERIRETHSRAPTAPCGIAVIVRQHQMWSGRVEKGREREGLSVSSSVSPLATSM